jgi:hypothetical protein
MAYVSIDELVEDMREKNMDMCIFCSEVDQRNEVTHILHDVFDMEFGDSGYAERYYNGDATDRYMNPFYGSNSGIEYMNGEADDVIVSYEEFMSLYDASYCQTLVASDEDLDALLA